MIAFKVNVLIQGYPELHYTIDGVLVKELVKEHDGSKGLTSSFVIDSNKPLL